jgi:hypothetical protein
MSSRKDNCIKFIMLSQHTKTMNEFARRGEFVGKMVTYPWIGVPLF